jgi:hypothetical protein
MDTLRAYVRDADLFRDHAGAGLLCRAGGALLNFRSALFATAARLSRPDAMGHVMKIPRRARHRLIGRLEPSPPARLFSGAMIAVQLIRSSRGVLEIGSVK